MLWTLVVYSEYRKTIKQHKAILADRDNDNPKDYMNYVWTDGREYYVGMGLHDRPMLYLYIIAIFPGEELRNTGQSGCEQLAGGMR